MRSLKLSSFVFLCSILLLGCSARRSQKVVLDDRGNMEAGFLVSPADTSSWKMVSVKGETFPPADSLNGYSCILVSFSVLNRLDYHALNTLKRYLEAGGGGVVAIRDTILHQKKWPWLQQWNNNPSGKKLKQDNSPLYILEKGYTSQALSDALSYAIGHNRYPDYGKAHTLAVPDSSRYTQIELAHGLDEPLEMAILPNSDVLFVERKGAVRIYDAAAKKVKTIAVLNVFSGIEDGLLGVALDPDFSHDHWIYLYYSPAGRDSVDRLSRFELIGDSLLMRSEKILLEVHTQRIYCCHTGGDVGFGPDGSLYVSVGDNTDADDPYKVGYPPVDERAGHELADDQATAANTNDLRGKILRIKPQSDGSYSIPGGNLFPNGRARTKPEIYVMGLRNPYRFTIDWKTNILYWGEVGPDTRVKGRDGSLMSYDEVNKAATAGFYGWPYFLGNNDAFPMYNFATGKEGPRKDPSHPINDSRNNTGLRVLPPARPAMIWYGKDSSTEFPLVGKGGASIMAGPVYHSDLFPDAPYKLSDYYNGKLFIYDWIRHWIMAVTLDKNGNYVRMEPFLENLDFSAPMDLKFGPDGALYALEYGTNWFSKNTDAKIVRIEYQEGNRSPIAFAKVDKHYGAAPMTVLFSAAGSKDYDKDDKLSYSWKIGDKVLVGQNTSYTFNSPGVYHAMLTVKDNHGANGTATVEVNVGNSPPRVSINTHSNKSFYWDKESLDYHVDVQDAEDKKIDTSRIKVSFGYLPNDKDVAVVLSGGQQLGSLKFVRGQQLISSLDCKSCHAINEKSVGPSFTSVASRYADKKGVIDKLAHKIIEGGSGNWGTRQMSAHPALALADAKVLVNYILSLSGDEARPKVSGSIALDKDKGKTRGAYILSASYTDNGANGIKPINGKDYIVLRYPRLQAEDYDEGNVKVLHIAVQNFGFITGIRHGSYIEFDHLDLTHIRHLRYKIQPGGPGGHIELHLDKPDGELISSIKVPAGKAPSYTEGWQEITTEVKETIGSHRLYFVFTNPQAQGKYLFNLDWIYFSNE